MAKRNRPQDSPSQGIFQQTAASKSQVCVGMVASSHPALSDRLGSGFPEKGKNVWGKNKAMSSFTLPITGSAAEGGLFFFCGEKGLDLAVEMKPPFGLLRIQ